MPALAPTVAIAGAIAAPVAAVPVVATLDATQPDAASAPVAAAAPLAQPAPTSMPSPMLASGAAGRVFAAALHAAAAPAASAPRAEEDHDPMVTAMLAGSAVAQAAPVALAQGTGLDLRHPGWPTRMAEQIEALRDAADAASTSIRVSPDALGPVDLQVRRDGDQVHVHFAAANPETRALIADAQPQLAAAAADRGLKLGQTSVGGDAAGWTSTAGQQSDGHGQGQGQGDQPRRAASATPRATTSTAASDDAATDTRIA